MNNPLPLSENYKQLTVTKQFSTMEVIEVIDLVSPSNLRKKQKVNPLNHQERTLQEEEKYKTLQSLH